MGTFPDTAKIKGHKITDFFWKESFFLLSKKIPAARRVFRKILFGCCTDKRLKQRMRRGHCTLIFRMILNSHIERMVFQFQGFYQACVRIYPAWSEAVILKLLFILGVEFVAVAVSFGDILSSVNLHQSRIRLERALPGTQTHCASFVFNTLRLF